MPIYTVHKAHNVISESCPALYRIAGNFRMVYISYCRAHHMKIKTIENFLAHVLRHYAELYKYLTYEILKWVVHTKICTNENYPLYGMQHTNVLVYNGLPFVVPCPPPKFSRGVKHSHPLTLMKRKVPSL